jgi:threonine synthase
MDQLKKTAKREEIAARAAASPASLGMWRYSSVLPDVTPVTLGEGWTPLLHSKRYPGLYIKEEGANPTGTFKARGLGMAVTMAKHYGLQHLAVPSAGNAAGALAAYAAAAGITAHIFMPQDVPLANYLEGIVYGADVTMVDGIISDCARMVAENMKAQKEANTPISQAWFDISTLKEPFRVEGKKTMGYELVEQLGWQYPDAVFYPTGGAWPRHVGLRRMEQLAGSRASAQDGRLRARAAGPSKAWKHQLASEFFQNATPCRLRPQPYADTIILAIGLVQGAYSDAPSYLLLVHILYFVNDKAITFFY